MTAPATPPDDSQAAPSGWDAVPPEWWGEKRTKPVIVTPATPNEGWPAAEAPEFSDESLARVFVERHANELRWVATWSCWLRWDGVRWAKDDTMHAFDLARAVCREAAAGCRGQPNLARTVASAKTVAAVERLAKADRQLAATVDPWDLDPWLVNTPGGVVDLLTGMTQPHRYDHYMTKVTAVTPGGTCPQWQAFLDRVTGGDTDLQTYLQRLAGYALTGSTREHSLAFLYGTGANGKSVLLSTVSGILGDYHRTAPIETFTASNTDRHPTELAMLQGARLVTATETEEGRRWAEAKIKTLTGGDRVSARFMRQDFFEYRPQFKLIIAGNHRPGLRSVDEAIRRRFHLVPFTVTIPTAERDPDLVDKLKAEWPGILQWMIEGCLHWQRQGLNPPEAVTAATRAYMEAQDSLASWIEECCERAPNGWQSSGDLFQSWKAWTERTGEYTGTAKRFAQALETHDFRAHRRNSRRGFHGIRLCPNHSGP